MIVQRHYFQINFYRRGCNRPGNIKRCVRFDRVPIWFKDV